MKQTIRRSISLIGITLVVMGFAMAAPKTQRANSQISVYGRVLRVDRAERTLLISDHWSKKLYLVKMPEGTRLEIFFGMGSAYDRPTFENVYETNLVRVRCIRTDREHLSKLDDGRQMVIMTASR